MSGHLKHLAMCAPMFVVAAILIARGTGIVAAMIPVLGCVVMVRTMGDGR